MLFGLGTIGFAQAPAKKDDAPQASFVALVERARKSDPTLDFKDLRFAYTETKDYSPYGGDRDSRQKMFAALNAKEFDKTIAFAEKILATNFVEVNANFAAFVANRDLGNADKAAFYKFMVQGLFKSIQGSVDGKTPETAFVVISTDEEYALFNFLGLRVASQALVNKSGHTYDQMTAINPKTNETVVYFFNIDKPLNWLGSALKKP